MAWKSIGRTHADLINQLKENRVITDKRVFGAMMAVDRGKYVQKEPYTDSPVPIGHGVTISAPHMHAAALDYLKDHLIPGNKALDVGSGSGYLTVCMARMVDVQNGGGKVVGIDVIKPLVDESVENVKNDDPDLLNNENFSLKYGDGWKGDPTNAPYDAIHVGAAAESVPDSLVEQLAPGGQMILPVGPEQGEQVFTSVSKDSEGRVEVKQLFGVRYVPLIKQKETEK